MRVVIPVSDATPVVISSVNSDIVTVDIPSFPVDLHVEHVVTTGMLSVTVVMSAPTDVVELSITTHPDPSGASTMSLLVSDNRAAALRSLCKSK